MVNLFSGGCWRKLGSGTQDILGFGGISLEFDTVLEICYVRFDID